MASSDDEAADLNARLDRIRNLSDDLRQRQAEGVESRAVAERIRRELDARRAALESPR